MQPKKGYARRVLAGRRPALRCAHCGTKLEGKNRKYCDRVCRTARMQQIKLERRPADLHCTHCGKPIDPLSRSPRDLKKKYIFCDSICVDAYRKTQDFYAVMSQRGQASAREYKDLHGRRHAHEARSKATSANNQTKPPKAKVRREGYRVWGYEVRMEPNADRTGYIASLPELPEAGQVEARTAKGALGKLREKFRAERG